MTSMLPRSAIALAASAMLALAASACQAERHYAPGVVDDALAGGLVYGPAAPLGTYRLGGGPGNDRRGCHTSSSGASLDAQAAPGTRFDCVEDFDAAGTSSYIEVGYQVNTTQDGCWTALRRSERFVTLDVHGPAPDLTIIPEQIEGCGLASV
jgi:hypothetical protein